MAADSAPWKPPPVRPLSDRARDTAIFAGGIGAVGGACASTFQHASAFLGMAVFGGGTAALAASFVCLRHVLVQGDFRKDNEAVTGIAMGTLVACVRTGAAGGRAGAIAGGLWFFGGSALHYAHRHWLSWRLRYGYHSLSE